MATQVADPDVLAHCVAIVAANNERDGEALMRLAERLRFGEVIAYSPLLKPAPFAHRLVFFLVHFDFPPTHKTQLLNHLRHSGSVSLCYAPVVAFLRDASVDEVRASIEMGFDDVINVPAEGASIAMRLAAQIGREHVYIETRNYLGPDRFRMDDPARGRAAEPHAQLAILRTVENGVNIVRREEIGKRG